MIISPSKATLTARSRASTAKQYGHPDATDRQRAYHAAIAEDLARHILAMRPRLTDAQLAHVVAILQGDAR